MAQAGAYLLQHPYGPIGPQEIDTYVSYLVQFIQELIDQTVPLARPSQQAQPWWNSTVAEAVYKERQARHS